MASNKISLRKISRDTNISPKTVRRFLNGEGDYYQNTVVNLCRYLGVDWQE
jgi:transcriptional regulator with XRE-family HTH domain